MGGLFKVLMVAVLVAETLAIGQGSDVARVLADVRAALGGDTKLASLETVMIEGTRTRVLNERSQSSAFEMALELPAKFMRKDVSGNINGIELTRTTGFNAGELIERADAPPSMGHGMTVMRMGGPAPSTQLLLPSSGKAKLGLDRRFCAKPPDAGASTSATRTLRFPFTVSSIPRTRAGATRHSAASLGDRR